MRTGWNSRISNPATPMGRSLDNVRREKKDGVHRNRKLDTGPACGDLYEGMNGGSQTISSRFQRNQTEDFSQPTWTFVRGSCQSRRHPEWPFGPA